jgi:hypothetical protein
MPNNPSSPTPVTVPLYPQLLSAGVGFKVGINLGFSSNSYRLYAFDTGGNGFWSGYGPWWPQTSQTSPTANISYVDGVRYEAIVVTATVYFADASGSQAATQASAQVAQIQTATGPGLGNWQEDINNNQAPVGGTYFGNFGAAMGTNVKVPGVLSQMPGGLNNGFCVTLGSYPEDQSDSLQGSLQIGLSASDIDGATNVIPLTPGAMELIPVGVLSIADTVINTTATPPGGGAPTPQPVHVLLDTGNPTTHITTGTVIPQDTLANLAGPVDTNGFGTLPAGLRLKLSSGDVTIMEFTTGLTPGKNLVTFSPGAAGGPGAVNTGLQPFFGNRVMFYPDSENAFISISPSSPESSATGPNP